ncbi:MAG TPA: hypothetical protein VJB14_07940 [Planctomycetota bacterium]|nr:hypothetical protein [Planctomycetota bacterium]
MAETRDFTLILVRDDGALGVDRLARTLSIDELTARQFCASAPVILAEGLTKSDVKDYSPKLAELSKAGLEFRITARPTRGLPKVHWANGQPFAGGEAEFAFNNRAFVCPECGESFVFQRSGTFSIEEPA